MDDNHPIMNDWEKLYELALQLKEMGPWDWMTDDKVFGVQDPETGEIGYCCVIGFLGEAFGLLIYRGEEGLRGYLKMRQMQGNEVDGFFLQKGLSITFEDRELVQKEDLKIIKDLGLVFKGRNEYPLFRRLDPGYLPWFMNKEDAKFLLSILPEALNTCRRFKADGSLCLTEDGYLIRSQQKGKDGFEWQDKRQGVKPLPSNEVPLSIDEFRLQRLKSAIPRTGNRWEFDYSYVEMFVEEEGRPYVPILLLVADTASDLIIHHEVLHPVGYHQKLFESFISLIEKVKTLPEEIIISRDEAEQMLRPIATHFSLKLTRVKKCSKIEKARKALVSSFMKQY